MTILKQKTERLDQINNENNPVEEEITEWNQEEEKSRDYDSVRLYLNEMAKTTAYPCRRNLPCEEDTGYEQTAPSQGAGF
ncbi:hypothetical protein [Candidatus Kuenenia stuttgartiensis]|uniref:hypothetical protein n=1 Tax=Kuenenia stuttgartiensis TaxID=174633 RepID=UPI00146F228C|nr:hypothetical protein [Candidatus Kuenenia stuttgartiensis]